MPGEKRREIRLAALVERAEEEREPTRDGEEDHDEHIRDRRREIARELALQHRGNARHHAAAPPVIDRNTSSSRPDGTRDARPFGVSSARILPCAMMIARLQTASTSSRRW